MKKLPFEDPVMFLKRTARLRARLAAEERARIAEEKRQERLERSWRDSLSRKSTSHTIAISDGMGQE